MATIETVKTCVYCGSELGCWFPKCTIDGCNNYSEICVPIDQREPGRYRCKEHLVCEVVGCDKKSRNAYPAGWENRYYCDRHYHEKLGRWQKNNRNKRNALLEDAMRDAYLRKHLKTQKVVAGDYIVLFRSECVGKIVREKAHAKKWKWSCGGQSGIESTQHECRKKIQAIIESRFAEIMP